MEREEVPILRLQQQDIEMVIPSEENIILLRSPIASPLSCNSSCAFSIHENNILEVEERSKSTTKLCGLIVFYVLVMIVEIIGGVKANSLAVFTDAAHLLSDVAGFSVSLFAVWASGWIATSRHSFGFGRLEVLGALFSVMLIWLISGILTYEAIDRFLHMSVTVNGKLMFAVAAFGFIVNFIMVLWLGHDHSHHACHSHNHNHSQSQNHSHTEDDFCSKNEQETELAHGAPEKMKVSNINMRGAYLHVIADLIQSVGVMIAGAIIWAKPGWLVADLICTLVFSAFVLCTTFPMLRNIYFILMERAPCEIDVIRLENDLKCMKGVKGVHDLHVWSITVGKFVMSCHVAADPGTNSADILHQIRNYCKQTYGIHHITAQIEQ